jgi:hypothetical protein
MLLAVIGKFNLSISFEALTDLYYEIYNIIYLFSQLNLLIGLKLKINFDSSIETFHQLYLASVLPFQVKGIYDGDGSFGCSIIKNKSKTSFLVLPTCTLAASVNPDNYKMLTIIKSFFGNVGSIQINNKNTYLYTVSGLKNCLILKTHFENYPLMTYKLVFFLL